MSPARLQFVVLTLVQQVASLVSRICPMRAFIKPTRHIERIGLHSAHSRRTLLRRNVLSVQGGCALTCRPHPHAGLHTQLDTPPLPAAQADPSLPLPAPEGDLGSRIPVSIYYCCPQTDHSSREATVRGSDSHGILNTRWPGPHRTLSCWQSPREAGAWWGPGVRPDCQQNTLWVQPEGCKHAGGTGRGTHPQPPSCSAQGHSCLPSMPAKLRLGRDSS